MTLNLHPNAVQILEERFLWKDPVTKELVETPEDLFKRVASNIASADKKYGIDPLINEKRFFKCLSQLDFVPNTPTLANAGRTHGAILSACFVIPVNDSIRQIYHAKAALAVIQACGGGTGFCFSRLREKNATVSNGSGTTSGPISFLESFDVDTQTIKQGGIRRGANMATFRVTHPDIEDFITLKSSEYLKHFEKDPNGEQRHQTENKILTNFNVSTLATDEFMEAVKNDETIDLVSPKDGLVVGTKKARYLLDLMAKGAWLTGDPGILFVDRMNVDNPFPSKGLYDATNPCGEQPLHDWDSCNLGHINLVNHMIYNSSSGTYSIDWSKIEETVALGIDFLDNVIDVNEYPLPELEHMCMSSRKIGLGIMGFADILLLLGVAYGSDKSYLVAEEIMQFVYSHAVKRSIERAQERESFPFFSESIYHEECPDWYLSPRLKYALDRFNLWDTFKKYGMRNSTLVTVAPTGTTARIPNVSFAEEPLFGPGFESRILDGAVQFNLNQYFEKLFKDFSLSEDDIRSCLEKGSVQHLAMIPEEVRQVYVCSYDLDYTQHIKMQAAFQKWTDSAVSKTINFPENATVSQIKDAYMLAYDLGCKGVTVYRNNCKNIQVLNLKEAETKQETKVVGRGFALPGMTYQYKYDNKSVYITVNQQDNKPAEIFVNVGKSGSDTTANCEALGKLASRMLQEGVSPDVIVHHLEGIHGATPTWNGRKVIKSYPDAVAQALKEFLTTRVSIEQQEVKKQEDFSLQTGLKCTDCG